jgi:hypothetical protein
MRWYFKSPCQAEGLIHRPGNREIRMIGYQIGKGHPGKLEVSFVYYKECIFIVKNSLDCLPIKENFTCVAFL